jgi:DNA-directed RNA polymerase sigma subunit (sigma70/sigma32)
MEEQLIFRQLAVMITAKARMAKSPRLAEALEARLRGATFEQIGEDLQVSPERARYMCEEALRRCRKAAMRLGLLNRRRPS